jgi:hypothetical protein
LIPNTNLSQTLAIAIARGEVDPTSKMPFEVIVALNFADSKLLLYLNIFNFPHVIGVTDLVALTPNGGCNRTKFVDTS